MSQSKTKNQSPDSSIVVVVLPGDDVSAHVSSKINHSPPPKVGSGLYFEPQLLQLHRVRPPQPGEVTPQQRVWANTAGRLESIAKNNTHFVRHNHKRYRPAVEDRVLGIVEERLGPDGNGGDYYRVHINASHPALLSNLAFEGATKRNRPSLQPGQVFYARVTDLNQGLLEVTLSCQLGPNDVGVPRRDWMTNEACYGELRGGTLARISIGLARELLQPDCFVLTELAAMNIAFEIAIGVNGFLWIHSTAPIYTIAILNAIQNSEVLTESQTRSMVKSIIFTAQKQQQQSVDAMEEE